jgi:hypothetical protein
MPIDLRNIRDPELVHWALGGLGAAWLALQVVHTRAQPLGWWGLVLMFLAVVLPGIARRRGTGQYHSERGRQRARESESVIVGAHSVTLPFRAILSLTGQ